jgi:hypothetical protein
MRRSLLTVQNDLQKRCLGLARENEGLQEQIVKLQELVKAQENNFLGQKIMIEKLMEKNKERDEHIIMLNIRYLRCYNLAKEYGFYKDVSSADILEKDNVV